MTRLLIKSDSISNGELIDNILENALEREKKLLAIALKRTKIQLHHFEKQYDMSSERFFELYLLGKLDDRNDYIDWAGEYQLFNNINEKIKNLEGIAIEYN